ncbi:hypothetical protein [Methylosinus trichosporium]|uniref:hypothetical protein n=1 Tax=Methylosinus TaxID=425 RepID=UPI0001D2EE3F|nr:hypothetical protein [Methylosinus trichosporium]OBS51580.1 hypothetical protein A8B73_15300 [Methylosinus sp. 3S-1]
MAELCPQFELPARLRKPRLNTLEASEYLMLQHGVKCAPATMAKLRSIGGGARYNKCGVSPVYPREALDEWALARLGRLKSNTSDIGDMQ